MSRPLLLIIGRTYHSNLGAVELVDIRPGFPPLLELRCTSGRIAVVPEAEAALRAADKHRKPTCYCRSYAYPHHRGLGRCKEAR